MATPPVLPTFLPIDVVTDKDIQNMPLMNTFRGDIVPAVIDLSGNIVNHPTPFYILCTAKIFNTNNAITSLPTRSATLIDTLTYQQFGLTAGNTDVFPATNGPLGNNTIPKSFFSLTTFDQALTSEVFTGGNLEESPGLMVPVYCLQDQNPSGNGTVAPAFFFFRADTFFESSLAPPIPDYNNYVDQIPEKPLNYRNFPSPFGKNISQFYYLSSLYTQYYNDNNRVGTWSLFATLTMINLINNANPNWKVGPAAAPVSIAFNDPNDSLGYNPTNILRSSTLYTVYKMNQYNDSTVYWSFGSPNTSIKEWIPQGSNEYSPPGVLHNLGYPLNFLYQAGNVNGYFPSQGYSNYYQQSKINYAGTICQSTPPFTYPATSVCSNSGWSIDLIARSYQGSYSNLIYTPFKFATNYFNEAGNIDQTQYSCACAGKYQWNGTCNAEATSVKENGEPTSNNVYYFNTCNMVHAGIFQFTAFQFIPINFFTAPPKGLIPPIVSPTDPVPPEPQNEEGTSGSIGPVGVAGPPWVIPTGATEVPVPPTGPTGAGIYTITYPFNGGTGAENNWPESGVGPNRMNNIVLTDNISGWITNPDSFACPRLVSDQNYCGFQDYYHSLMGYFYPRPQDLQNNDTCGDVYIPPPINMQTIGLNPQGACQNGNICVPNYVYLNDPTNMSYQPFYCQSPTGANPYPESENGFNNSNAYPILNFLGTTAIATQPQTYTPITWLNLSIYDNLSPIQGLPANQVNYSKVPYFDTTNLARNKNINPTTGETKKNGDSPIYLILAIIGIIVIVGIFIFFITRTSSSKAKDMFNPMNFQYYQKAL